jgi:Cu/Ag efflux protein CusF
MTKRLRICACLVTIACAASVLTTYAAQTKQPPKGQKEYTFKGKVEGIDTKAKTLRINGENVQGWMAAMTMSYKVDRDDAVTRVKVGDQITAKVYDGDFMTLYDIQVVPPKDGKAPPAKK